jgi:hypothetical protein
LIEAVTPKENEGPAKEGGKRRKKGRNGWMDGWKDSAKEIKGNIYISI